MLSQITIHSMFFFVSESDLTSNVSPKTNSAVVNEKGNNNDYIISMRNKNIISIKNKKSFLRQIRDILLTATDNHQQ